MPRQQRIEYPGAIYHVMNRGDRREPIFHDGIINVLCNRPSQSLNQDEAAKLDARLKLLEATGFEFGM